jgi:hypothetical protein
VLDCLKDGEPDCDDDVSHCINIVPVYRVDQKTFTGGNIPQTNEHTKSVKTFG